MLFGKTSLRIHNKEKKFSLLFCAKDALKCVDNKKDLMKVAVAEAWQESRQAISILLFYFYIYYIFFFLPLNEEIMEIHSIIN